MSEWVRVGDPQVLIRMGGLYHDVDLKGLGVTSSSSTGALLSAVAAYLGVRVRTVCESAQVERTLSGNIVVRDRSWRPAA